MTYVVLYGTRPAPCTTEALAASSPHPLVAFSAVVLDHGNASFSIIAAQVCPPPTAYRFNLGYAGEGGPAGDFAMSGQSTVTTVSNTTFLFSWTDTDGQGLVNVGDTFTVSGDGRALPGGEDMTFYLYWLDMTLIAARNWRT